MSTVNSSTEIVSVVDGALTSVEQDRRDALEKIIGRGLQGFVEVGQALAEMRESKLFKNTHSTFIEYCRDQWGLSTSSASRHISASEAVLALPIGTSSVLTPANEGQARELVGLDPDIAVDVMRRANEATDGKVTATAIKNARAEIDGTQTHPGRRLDNVSRSEAFSADRDKFHTDLRSEVEWLTAWAAWALKRDGHSLIEIAAMGRAECWTLNPETGEQVRPEAESWPHLKDETYGHYFIQSQDGGRLLVQGLSAPSIVYSYITEWQRALDDGATSFVEGQVWVPIRDFPDELYDIRIDAAMRAEFGDEYVDAQNEDEDDAEFQLAVERARTQMENDGKPSLDGMLNLVADRLWFAAASGMTNAITGQEIADAIANWQAEQAEAGAAGMDYAGSDRMRGFLDQFAEWVTNPALEAEWNDPNCWPQRDRPGGLEEWLHEMVRRPLDDWKNLIDDFVQLVANNYVDITHEEAQ